ncbi:MAG: amidohydrolase family protein [Planctomycetota bacterium]
MAAPLRLSLLPPVLDGLALLTTTAGARGGGESLSSVDDAIRAYTIDAAYLMRQEDRVGTIEVGRPADLIVLDRSIASIPLAQIGATQVLLTLLDGDEVWRDPSF